MVACARKCSCQVLNILPYYICTSQMCYNLALVELLACYHLVRLGVTYNIFVSAKRSCTLFMWKPPQKLHSTKTKILGVLVPMYVHTYIIQGSLQAPLLVHFIDGNWRVTPQLFIALLRIAAYIIDTMYAVRLYCFCL